MALEGWKVKEVYRKDITAFVEKWHYSKSINGCIADYCYGLYDTDGGLRGAMFFGRMAMRNQYKRFCDNEKDVIELRRLCCDDYTPKNAETFFLGRAIKLLKKSWSGKAIVSYADEEYGHAGTIYKAGNFKQIEDIKGARVILWKGRRYHDKAIRTKYKGKLKPFAKRLKEALENGEAKYKTTKGKHTFVYWLK